MALLKEDGRLDVERIINLPLEECMKEIGGLTNEQYKYLVSKLPLNESKECSRAIPTDRTIEEELKMGAVLSEDF